MLGDRSAMHSENMFKSGITRVWAQCFIREKRHNEIGTLSQKPRVHKLIFT